MEHEVDEHGNQIHIDVDELIPTGICKFCKEEAEVAEETPVEEEPVEE